MDEPVDESFAPGYKDSNVYSQEALRAILTATKSANDLPSSGDDFDYYSTFPGFRAIMLRKGQAILSLMTSLVQNHGVREKFQGRELEEKYDLLVDVNDLILENVSNYLDEADGPKKSEEELVLAVKPPSSINTSWNKKQFNSGSPKSYKLLTAKNISRPQLSFKDKIDNSNSVFVPIIKEKPNSIKPLAVVLENDKEEFCHPYEWEIEKFSPSEEHLNLMNSMSSKPLEETPLVMVKTEEELILLCSDLKKEKEIAIDLEHHSYRSFQGFTCLMQISTREKDYIVDVLALRSEMHQLNDVFTDPKIVKILHGADMDVVWLQRDFGIYIVNLFDSGQAARVLHFPHLSLAYLLKHYCKIDLDKRFQLADWRIRPLPAEMIKYAREDTHYLLYVYDCLKNDLIKNGNEMKNLLYSTLERSKVICAKKYQKPLFSEDKYLELYKKNKKALNTKQLYCLKELFSWRDRLARENDESIGYVLPNHMMMQIAEALPREQQGILACCNPIPPLVKQQLNELHSIVLKTNESSLKQLEILQLQQNAQTPKIHNNIDLSSLVHCPHDIHHLEDKVQSANQSGNSENLLPLIAHSSTTESAVTLINKKPALSALFQSQPKKMKVGDTIVKKIPENVIDLISKLVSPFDRYKITEELHAEEESKRKQTQVKVNNEKSDEADSVAEASSLNDISVLNDSVEVSECSPFVSTSNSKVTIPNTSNVTSSTPLRRKSKKKRKIDKGDPDITLLVPDGPSPSKKACTPEVVTIDDDSFTPYDYSQSGHSKFSGKKNAKEKNSQEKQNHYQTPRPYFGKKRKHAKQATFSKDSSSSHSSTSNWPKNK